ncbi:hypothetical protein PIROE2DRAFT_62161 [Piromyces sp. E2]|nr:hypothetical protein PIROE2DRAFT_62161 [Piromyces sp. E2]|eukprot:OUM62043.1 hypothetical protein PIROE2DRAFT_62161 [Piromyces sp. E2]
MGYFRDLIDKQLYSPYEQISAVNTKFIRSKETVIIMKIKVSLFSKFEYKMEEDGVKCFKSSVLFNKKVLYTMNEEPLLNMNSESSSPKKTRLIYDGKKKDKLISSVETIKFQKGMKKIKHKVTFDNIAVKDQRTLEMNCDKKFCACGIFYGEEDINSPLVCKISRIPHERYKFKIEIAPGVDIVFMLALAIIFADKVKFYRILKNRDSDYVDGDSDDFSEADYDDFDFDDDGDDGDDDDGDDGDD